MNFKPLNDRILVKREDELTETTGGILIPDSAQERPYRGQVLAVGEGKTGEDGTLRPMDIQIGETVLFGKYAGTEIKLTEEEHMILREEDILGIVEA
jgi:chaperonin GroES